MVGVNKMLEKPKEELEIISVIGGMWDTLEELQEKLKEEGK